MNSITSNDIHDMARHWLNTPVGAYLGSGYGQDIKALLQLPQVDGMADEFLRKMRTDVQVLNALPPGSVNLYGITSQSDRLDLVVEVAGQAIEVTRG